MICIRSGKGDDALCERVIGCAITVHRTLGPGLLESIYRDGLIAELVLNGLRVGSEVRVPVDYRGQRIRDDLRLDLLVNGILFVEVKSVLEIHQVHEAQLITYLRVADKPIGLIRSPTFRGLRLPILIS